MNSPGKPLEGPYALPTFVFGDAANFAPYCVVHSSFDCAHLDQRDEREA